jgi:hypothetical protein
MTVVLALMAAIAAALGVGWFVAAVLQTLSAFLESAAASGHERRVKNGETDAVSGRAVRVAFSALNSIALLLLVIHAGFRPHLTMLTIPLWMVALSLLVFLTIGAGISGKLVGRDADVNLATPALIASIASLAVSLFVFMPTLFQLIHMMRNGWVIVQ